MNTTDCSTLFPATEGGRTAMEYRIRFQSATSGLWYDNPGVAGGVVVIELDGIRFAHAGTVDLFRSHLIDELKAENAKLCEDKVALAEALKQARWVALDNPNLEGDSRKNFAAECDEALKRA